MALTESLPSLGKVIPLLPLRETAQALVQVLEARTTRPVIHLHLVNLTPSKWDEIFHYIAEELNVPLIPYPEWFSRLKEVSGTAKDSQEHQALRLLGFYETLNQESGSEAGGLQPCSTEVARGMCPILNTESLREVKAEEIQRWLGYWESLGLLKLSRVRGVTSVPRECS